MGPWRADTVFFDAAGTLFHTRGSIGEIYGRHAAEFGLPGGKQETVQKQIQAAFVSALRERTPFLRDLGSGGKIQEREREWWRGVVSQTFSSVGDFPQIGSFFDHIYPLFQTARVWALEPHCREVLEGLRETGRSLGIISNFDSRLEPLLEALGVRAYFDTVVIPSLGSGVKPDREIFLLALQKAGATDALHIGDSLEEDYQGARDAGLNSLLYDPLDRHAARSEVCRIRSLRETFRFLV